MRPVRRPRTPYPWTRPCRNVGVPNRFPAVSEPVGRLCHRAHWRGAGFGRATLHSLLDSDGRECRRQRCALVETHAARTGLPGEFPPLPEPILLRRFGPDAAAGSYTATLTARDVVSPHRCRHVLT